MLVTHPFISFSSISAGVRLPRYDLNPFSLKREHISFVLIRQVLLSALFEYR